MPIRMEKDENGDNRKQDNYPGGKKTTQGGGGSMTTLIPMILSIIGRKPKLLFFFLLLAGGYFIVNNIFLSGNDPTNIVSQEDSDWGTGMNMKQEVYDEAEVFEPLADNTKNPMPESVSLKEYCPVRLNQGRQGSCVGWASGYAARTILNSRATGINPNRLPFSPAYVYNQIALENCQGAYMVKAMETMKQDGALPMSQFGYDETTCRVLPNRSERQDASTYRITGYNRLTENHDDYKTDMLAIKQNLAQGAPVVIGMEVGGSFMSNMVGQETWYPTRQDYSKMGYSGHAMCVIGYDDYKEGGAFQIMNSWGEDWGDEGIAWVRYKDFDFFVREAYGLYPMGDANKSTTSDFNVAFGLVDNNSGKNIPLVSKSGNVFSSKSPLNVGQKFKVEFTNSIACYTYVFGQETDGSSYVLFPYTKKHSPYCGITGTRLFPSDYSMVVDDKGNKDYFAIVVSKDPLDFTELNKLISSSPQASYADKINDVLKSVAIPGVQFGTNGETVSFRANAQSERQVVAMIIEAEK